MNHTGIDFIGDIHGHADELEQLLNKMGYSKKGAVWKHPNRIAFFAGDFIDRGPKIVETLDIVRNMVEIGSTQAVMGNHEYNAICFNWEKDDGSFLREHSDKNVNQHSETIRQFRGRQEEYKHYINWFKTLPLFYESDKFRGGHATWDHKKVKHVINLTGEGKLTDELIDQSADKTTDLYNSVDTLLKGRELELPEGHSFLDIAGHERDAIRIKWWENPEDHTYDSIAVGNIKGLPEVAIEKPGLVNESVYGEYKKPVFFGHYWLNGKPNLYRENICCLDYSVAKGGNLVAYRFDGEERLLDEKLVYGS